MKIKVSIQELIDNDALFNYANARGEDVEELSEEPEREVYLSQHEAEKWGFYIKPLRKGERDE